MPGFSESSMGLEILVDKVLNSVTNDSDGELAQVGELF
jgi:hypothetical protein